MKKIMFNELYGLQTAVLSVRKTMTGMPKGHPGYALACCHFESKNS